jgi:DNA polymerase V
VKIKKDKGPLESYAVHFPDIASEKVINFYLQNIPAGFPSPAEDFLEKRLDLNDYLIKNQSATFLVKVEGTSMTGAGIHHGDVLVVDRSVEPGHSKIVLGVLNGEFTVKRLLKKGNDVFLMPENKAFQPIKLNPEMDFKVWGVVTFVLHKV